MPNILNVGHYFSNILVHMCIQKPVRHFRWRVLMFGEVLNTPLESH